MSPQDSATTSTPPAGNVFFYLCGLSITQLLNDKWMSVILENTGAPYHSTGHDFQVTVIQLDVAGHPIQIEKVPLAGFNNNDRQLIFKSEDNPSASGKYDDTAAGIFHINKMEDFVNLKKPPGPAKIVRSRQILITKVQFPPGVGFTASVDSKGIGKCFGLASECTSGTKITIESTNGASESHKIAFEIPAYGKLLIMLNNDCANPTGESDLPYYYHVPPKFFGIIDPHNKSLDGGRVACNARLVSDLIGGKSILDSV